VLHASAQSTAAASEAPLHTEPLAKRTRVVADESDAYARALLAAAPGALATPADVRSFLAQPPPFPVLVDESHATLLAEGANCFPMQVRPPERSMAELEALLSGGGGSLQEPGAWQLSVLALCAFTSAAAAQLLACCRPSVPGMWRAAAGISCSCWTVTAYYAISMHTVSPMAYLPVRHW
jgi:hypothetical protein